MADTRPDKSDRKRVTLREVAQEAGVSLKTASNVINHSGRMADATREKVQDVIDRLGYRVNVSARNLNRGKTGFITLAVPSLTAPYLAELANRVIDAARIYGYSVYVTIYAEGSAQGARTLLRNFNTTVSDGMILSISEVEKLDPKDLDVDYPLVCVGARSTHDKADHVTPDDVQEARLAAQYLFDHGATNLAVIGSRTDPEHILDLRDAMEGNAQLRMRGVFEACANQGVELDARLVPNTGQDWTIGSGARMTQHIVDSGIPFDGIVAFNDQLALGALFTLAANGIAVPDRVQVIGFDNNEEAAYFQPPLTTMDSCLDWIAPTAVSRIINRIDGSRTLEPELITTQSRVIARATTRA
ncbi:MAG: LacI family DNA-binding transcriptional regulator [Bifidobacterium sp.]|uniref:LacI family DNA-binding transcriptional regulator n=1 Tax=Bifidobacterium sp. TaxID=41200 RepID=UPI002848562F|nr:LacI family DNA-binding transcriptional regulator [Bifidobacterium sp.]MDR3887310.1 LacI family DNA-binding transcriptional regulator [Bifidobacterium sp.]